MTKQLFILLFGTLLMFGCLGVAKGSVENTTDQIVCSEPYIRHGDSCCLDQNDNRICDSDEILECEGNGANYCSEDVRYYNAECVEGTWEYESEHCSFGCLDGVCKSQTCPSSCDDGNPCTSDYCSATTNYVCRHDSLSGSQSGCSGSAGTCKTYSCIGGECMTKDTVPCCGNRICESSETYISCSRDCEAPSPDIYLVIDGCDTGYDIRHGLGEVTNIYVTISNMGNADASNINLEASATDEGEAHPDKYIVVSTLPAGYQTTKKMTVDTTYKVIGTVYVEASWGASGYTVQNTAQCAQIDPGTLQTLGELLKIYSTGGVPI